MRATLLLLAVLGLTHASQAHAQVRASERGRVSQTADGTTLTIDYGRPRARGRAELFGGVVHWGEVWTPGANWATTLDVDRDVTLDGHAVPKGKYSLWFVVRRGDWTVILDPRFDRYHADPPDSTAQQLRWTVRPQAAPATDVLTWTFPEVRPDGMQLRFEWGTTRVVIDAAVKPTRPLTIARADAEPFLGTYRWKWQDSTGAEEAGTVELYYEGGMVKQRYAPFPSWYPALQHQIMVRINDDWFIPTVVRDGKVWEMVADMVFEFDVSNGRATGFTMRDDRDNLLGSGARVAGK